MTVFCSFGESFLHEDRSLVNEAMLCSLTKALSAGKALVND